MLLSREPARGNKDKRFHVSSLLRKLINRYVFPIIIQRSFFFGSTVSFYSISLYSCNHPHLLLYIPSFNFLYHYISIVIIYIYIYYIFLYFASSYNLFSYISLYLHLYFFIAKFIGTYHFYLYILVIFPISLCLHISSTYFLHLRFNLHSLSKYKLYISIFPSLMKCIKSSQLPRSSWESRPIKTIPVPTILEVNLYPIARKNYLEGKKETFRSGGP